MVDHHLHLGAELSYNLKYNLHIDNICKKASSVFGIPEAQPLTLCTKGQGKSIPQPSSTKARVCNTNMESTTETDRTTRSGI